MFKRKPPPEPNCIWKGPDNTPELIASATKTKLHLEGEENHENQENQNGTEVHHTD